MRTLAIILLLSTACRNVTDEDGDGVVAELDCNDLDAAIHPGVPEICDGIDQNCDGVVDNFATDVSTFYADTDADGFGDAGRPMEGCDRPEGYVVDATDCDDQDERIFPGAEEADCTDATDYNCDGSVGYADADGDGVPACEDCDDSQGAVHPGAAELCNGIDDNCDGSVDEEGAVGAQRYYADADGDTYGDPATPVMACSQPEGAVTTATDCDDMAAAIHPGADEVCNGADDDCNGSIDEEPSDGTAWFLDVDGDGAAGSSVTVVSCEAPAGYFASATDCDDVNAAVFPGASEVCDGVDNDCDTQVDEAGATGERTWYADGDGDGYGADASTLVACQVPAGYVALAGDCDDAKRAVNPTATERCNGLDDDCDGQVDVAAVDASTWFADADSDGHGDGAAMVKECQQPTGYVTTSDDCDDQVGTTFPGADEVCNGVDDNCNRSIDESPTDGTTWFLDVDGDGAAGSSVSLAACAAPTGYYASATDCDDVNAKVFPGATEVCDGVDNDCDTEVDEAGAVGERTWYADADGDGFGDDTSSVAACTIPSGHVAAAGDCDDAKRAVNPAATERCNGVDDDCDTLVDNGASDASPWYADTDGDGHGDVADMVRECSKPTGYVFSADDCDDTVATTYLGAPELCNGVDDDCNNSIDVGAVDATTFYLDADGDGHGTTAQTMHVCAAPSGYVAVGTDCDDSVSTTYLGAAELCNGVDDDCDKTIDNGLSLQAFYQDFDGDTFGDINQAIDACAAPAGTVSDNTDCDDAAVDVFPGALEVCDDGIDNDCDTFADCLDNADCRDVDAICWSCGDGYLTPDEQCDDGNNVDGDGCSATCTLEIDTTGVFNSYPSESRTVYVWKSNSAAALSTYNTFCEDRGLQWFVPKTQADAQKAITTTYSYDNYHTWIITKNNTTSGTWGGFSVTVDSPSCVSYSSSGFSAIRKWACSYCDPESYGVTKCWDGGHVYDWLLCQDG